MKRLRACLALACLALLSGCIFVDDFGSAWNEAKPDSCISKLATSVYYTDLRRDPSGLDMDRLAHVLTLGDQKFLLLKQSYNDKGGRLYRIAIVKGSVAGGIFQRFRLDPTMRETFLRDYPHAPVKVTRDTVTIATLDAATEKLLLDISHKPEYWQIEEQALYDVLRDPACKLDANPPPSPELSSPVKAQSH